MAALPTIIPIFPLPNLVLFPGLSVPLHIFEPRYREMIADVADAHGIIGMALLKGDWEDRLPRLSRYLRDRVRGQDRRSRSSWPTAATTWCSKGVAEFGSCAKFATAHIDRRR